jgi:hypothetical protein
VLLAQHLKPVSKAGSDALGYVLRLRIERLQLPRLHGNRRLHLLSPEGCFGGVVGVMAILQ